MKSGAAVSTKRVTVRTPDYATLHPGYRPADFANAWTMPNSIVFGIRNTRTVLVT